MPGEDEDGIDLDPAQLVIAGGRLPSKRRFVLGTSLGLVTAIGANFLGVTSFLLSLNESMARKTNLDVLYSVKGYRRCLDSDNGYTFIFPGDWLADQTLYQRYARRVEQQNPLDPPPLKKKARRDLSEPTAAYGPPGSTGELNVSVVVAPIEPGFALKQLGSPSKAGEFLLNSFIAPPTQQDKVAELISASSVERDGFGYLVLEFTVFSSLKKWKRHNVAVFATRNNFLFTLNAQCNEKSWSKEKGKLLTVANSFRIL